MTVELAAGADLSKVMCGVGGSAVEIGRIMVAGVEVWPGLVHIEDDFNRLNGDVGANYDYTPGAGFGSQRPVIFGNAMRAGVPTSSAPGNVCFGILGHVKRMRRENRRIQGVLSGNPALLNAMLVLKANEGLTASAEMNIVSQGDPHAAGISNVLNSALGATRGVYTPSLVTSGDTCGLECWVLGTDTVYIAFRIRSGVRLNLCAWRDTGSAVIPADGSFMRCGPTTAAQYNAQYGPSWDSWSADDLPNYVVQAFASRGATKTATAWPASNGAWVDVQGWTADTGSYPGSEILDDGRSLFLAGGKAGTTFNVSAPFSGGSSSRQHQLRIVRSDDGTVIAASNTVTANSGTCTISGATDTTADLQRYKLQSRTTGTSGGGNFTAGGYFRIT